MILATRYGLLPPAILLMVGTKAIDLGVGLFKANYPYNFDQSVILEILIRIT
jgi:hypothetical protein